MRGLVPGTTPLRRNVDGGVDVGVGNVGCRLAVSMWVSMRGRNSRCRPQDNDDPIRLDWEQLRIDRRTAGRSPDCTEWCVARAGLTAFLVTASEPRPFEPARATAYVEVIRAGLADWLPAWQAEPYLADVLTGSATD